MTTETLDTKNVILNMIVDALIDRFSLDASTCYKIAVPMFVEGQGRLVMQVAMGTVQREGGGRGAQEGGSLVRSSTVTFNVWRRSKVERFGHSEHVIAEETTGMLSLIESVWNLFSMTTLGGVLAEPMEYDSETESNWYDIDKGVMRRDLSLSVVWAVNRPTQATIYPVE